MRALCKLPAERFLCGIHCMVSGEGLTPDPAIRFCGPEFGSVRIRDEEAQSRSDDSRTKGHLRARGQGDTPPDHAIEHGLLWPSKQRWPIRRSVAPRP